MLALYLHHDDDAFSKVFCPLLTDEELINILEVYSLFLPWDITDTKNHVIIRKMISAYNELNFIETRISRKKSALLLIAPIGNTITSFGILQGKMSKGEICEKVQLYCESFEVEMNCERTLCESQDEDTVKIDSQHYQQMMFDMLGDRDYDAFEKHQHEHLKEKIAFAFFGPPQSMDESATETASLLDCYTHKQKEKITAVYNKICEIYEPYAEYENQIIISFIYNCTEPLPQEKQRKRKEAEEKNLPYDPETDIFPLPIFVLRKCILKSCEDRNPCRIFIDHDLRVYTDWMGYIENNKLPSCMMVLPKDGRYKGDSNGQVLLEYHLAPSCGIKADVLKGLDITSTVLGLGSGVVFATALIPTVALAPVALIGAGIVGAGVGIYSLVRSAIHLADRHKHCEDMNPITNSEARGSYINIVAGSLGFVGAGATTVVSQLVSQGVNVGRTAQSAVTAINVINLGASGAGILHSSYEIYIQWREENVVPSTLTILQLSSSVLFFGNAVYNFRTGAAIVEETQTRVLQEYQDGLRSNRHRKTFNKMRLETIRQRDGNVASAQADVIATIRQIPDQNEVFAVLTRSNRMFNRNNVRFAANNAGEITLNGVSVDISQFGGLSKADQTAFLLELPPTPTLSPEQTLAITRVIKSVFSLNNIRMLTQIATIPPNLTSLLSVFEPAIQEMLLKCLSKLLNSIDLDIIDVFKQVLPDRNVMETALRFIISFFKMKMIPYEQDYVTQREDERSSPGFDERDFASRLKVSADTGRRALIFFEQVVTAAFSDGDVKQTILRELIDSFIKWMVEQIYNYEQNRALREERGSARAATKCKSCGGFYFKK